MKQTLLVLASIFIAAISFAQGKPKDSTVKIASGKDSAGKPKDTAPAKAYFFKTSLEQIKNMQIVFQNYNADDLSDAGKYKAWQDFLRIFTIDSTYVHKK